MPCKLCAPLNRRSKINIRQWILLVTILSFLGEYMDGDQLWDTDDEYDNMINYQ
jgi:hypothetical protein